MAAYYNEWDKPTAAWLRELAARGLVAPGIVDDRSITDVRPDDLMGYDQCHFFAGIGGWSLALRLAGWPDDLPVWTGSPPCQPFSVAGKRKGQADERHLAPVWLDLVRECRPSTIFGEQVEGAIAFGWLDELFNELEAIGYACRAFVLPACSVGAPHIRQRLWIVAERNNDELVDADRKRRDILDTHVFRGRQNENSDETSRNGALGRMANAGHTRHKRHKAQLRRSFTPANDNVFRSSSTRDMENANKFRQTHTKPVDGTNIVRTRNAAETSSLEVHQQLRYARDGNLWKNPDLVYCRDSAWRPFESGSFPLVDGVPASVGRLRAYGNAIVPQVAAEVIKAYIDVRGIEAKHVDD